MADVADPTAASMADTEPKTEAAPAHPGDGITAKVLSKRWHSMPKSPVLGFYGHGTYAGEYACFSNFYDQSDEPFTFVVADELWNVDLNVKERTTSCTFSEKAIMLCKAAVMGDGETYGMIQRCREPRKAKALGRQVENFDSEEWDRVVCKVAYEAVYQKFRSSPEFRRILSETGEQVIAEATRNDSIWGIGIDVGDKRVNSPSLWLGSNILGWALMEVRDTLAKEQEPEPELEASQVTCESGDVATSSREAPVHSKPKRRWMKKDP